MNNFSKMKSFYFINNTKSQNLELGDWILAYRNKILVGSREYDSQMIMDIPIMGNDGLEYSSGYCSIGDKVHFEIQKKIVPASD